MCPKSKYRNSMYINKSMHLDVGKKSNSKYARMQSWCFVPNMLV